MGLLKTDGSVLYRWKMMLNDSLADGPFYNNDSISDDPVQVVLSALNSVSTFGDAMVERHYIRRIIDSLDEDHRTEDVTYENIHRTTFNIRRIIRWPGDDYCLYSPEDHAELFFYVGPTESWCQVNFEVINLDGIDLRVVLGEVIKKKIAEADTEAKTLRLIERIIGRRFDMKKDLH